VGLGKTIQVIALIAHLLTQGVNGPFLVVAPLATLPNWVREFEKWLPVRPVVRYHGTGPEREAMMRDKLNPKQRKSPDFPFIVTSYEVAIRDQSKLEKLCNFTYLIGKSIKAAPSVVDLSVCLPIQHPHTHPWILASFHCISG
jgi:ATP-dependent DNA helicase